MKIDIDKLTESELIDLNHRVVERLRFINQMHAHVEMLEFKTATALCSKPVIAASWRACSPGTIGKPLR
jgi:hypothetical protein